MTSKNISNAVGNISDRYISEAAGFPAAGRRRRFFQTPVGRAVAALFALCLLAGGITILTPNGGTAVAVYTDGTNEEIPAAGAVLSTGSINDRGERKGHPLMFYLSGKDIASVRFSCKNEKLCFMDWTEQREEFGNAQNFTVPYGEDESEYYYLTIDWVPELIDQALSGTEATISTLPDHLREDIIVMEITSANGKKDTKAITVMLREDGTFFASFGDYTITEADAFVRRPDSKAIPREELYAREDSVGKAELDIFQELKGLEYQPYTCDGLPEYRLVDNNGTVYYLNFSEKWVWRGKAEEAPLPDELITWLKNNQEVVDMETLFSQSAVTVIDLPAAEEAAMAYYEGTVFEVVSLKWKSQEGNQVTFSARVKKGGVVQEPDRFITLELLDGAWAVANEGY